ncbi:hypothetical protein CQ14_41275 [Bradyrhizobium lablabi]|uniref:Uncharacterized protein n=1 Tax=Bradyrhizobium lablabi TaxID=722472 RepID=A0A0R3N813_9BRAD|nr:hypothetical protein CQ14_41275 [Bradyrhizobium lablabi]
MLCPAIRAKIFRFLNKRAAKMQTSGDERREIAPSHSVVIARLAASAKSADCFAPLAMTLMGRGV